eukprot:1151380-Pelagomonas_calceolata.AAC.2
MPGPLRGEPDSAFRIRLGCKHFTMSNMIIERHNIASRILLKGISKGPLGVGLASMDIGSADRLALQDLQILERSTNRTLPKFTFLCRSSDEQRLTSSHPGAISVPMKKVTLGTVPRINCPYPSRSRGGR